MNVILHVPDKARIKNAFSNAKNFIQDIVEQRDVLLVFNADAVKEVINMELPEELVNASVVKFLLCNNTLKASDIDHRHLPGRFTIIPAAITYIVQQQALGAYYIRP
ncbi:hypothetical protein M1E08_11700 [Erwinia sp. PK3-005]